MDQIDLLDLANDAVILTDAAGTITYWNQGACRTYGWEKSEALGQNVHALLRTDLSGDGGQRRRSFSLPPFLSDCPNAKARTRS